MHRDLSDRSPVLCPQEVVDRTIAKALPGYEKERRFTLVTTERMLSSTEIIVTKKMWM
jgi:hypothetical protein